MAIADSTTPLTREEWNELIGRVNEKISEDHDDEKHEDDGDRPCTSPSELEEVEENHIWTKEDIEDMQEVLEDMCPNVEFTELEEMQKWKVWIIEELEDAIEQAWCDCVKDECTCEEKTINVHTVSVSVNDLGKDNPWCDELGLPNVCDADSECPKGDWASFNDGLCITSPGSKAAFQLVFLNTRCSTSFNVEECGEFLGFGSHFRDAGLADCDSGCIASRDERLAALGAPPDDPDDRETCLSLTPQPCHECAVLVEKCFLFWCAEIRCETACPCGECTDADHREYDCGSRIAPCLAEHEPHWEVRVFCVDDDDGDGNVPCNECCPGEVSGQSFANRCGICIGECGYTEGLSEPCCYVACECDEDNSGCVLPEDNPETEIDDRACFCKEVGHPDYQGENCEEPEPS